jgi:hypothetical protein
MPKLGLKLKQASAVLQIQPKELQNLVQFGVVKPKPFSKRVIALWLRSKLMTTPGDVRLVLGGQGTVRSLLG